MGTCQPEVMDSAAATPSRRSRRPLGGHWELAGRSAVYRPVQGADVRGRSPSSWGKLVPCPRPRPEPGPPAGSQAQLTRRPSGSWHGHRPQPRGGPQAWEVSLGRTAPHTCVPLGPSGAGGSPKLPASLLQAPRGPDHPPWCHRTRRGQPPVPTRTNAAHSSLPLPWLQSKLCLWGQFLVSGVPPKGHLLPHLPSANVRTAGAAKLTVCSDFCHFFCCPGHMGLPSPCGWDSF